MTAQTLGRRPRALAVGARISTRIRTPDRARSTGGFHADFTGFPEDPAVVAPDTLIDVPVTLTLVGRCAVDLQEAPHEH